MLNYNTHVNTVIDYFSFLQENLSCKVSLVTTACDERTGHFAYNLYRFLAVFDEKTSQCDVSYVPVKNYEGEILKILLVNGPTA
jgi:hypothetical protein